MAATSAIAQPVVYEDQPNHLECYQIKDVKDSVLYNMNISSVDEDILPANTIDKTCTFKRFSREFCVAAKTANTVPTPPSDSVASTNGAVPDAFDYICYNIRCSRADQPAAGTQITIEDRFGPRNVYVRKMKRVCVPIIAK